MDPQVQALNEIIEQQKAMIERLCGENERLQKEIATTLKLAENALSELVKFRYQLDKNDGTLTVH